MEEIGVKVEEKLEDLTTGSTTSQEDLKNADLEDLYTKYKKLQQQLEFLQVQEEYIKDEQRNLKKEYLHAQEEVKRIQSVPLVIGQFLEAVDQNTGIVGSTTGSNYYVRILSTLDRELLKPSHLLLCTSTQMLLSMYFHQKQIRQFLCCKQMKNLKFRIMTLEEWICRSKK